MRPGKLKKITNGKYEVDDESFCIIDEYGEKICNFYISDFTLYSLADKDISFHVKLKKEDPAVEDEATIPITYWNAPSSWLRRYFDRAFRSCSPKYDNAMLQVMNALAAVEKNTEEINFGWRMEDVQKAWHTESLPFFDCFDEEDDIDSYKGVSSFSCLFNESLNLSRPMTAVPLLSYTLFSLMSTLDMLGHNRRPSFIMSLTGATETVRNQTALLYTNLFKRSLDMIKNDYMDIHIMPEDHISDVIYKTLRGKDSVVIAFSPDKRRCSHLKKIYTQTHMEDDYTVNGLLLLIKAAKEEIPFPTVNINLPSDFDIEAIKNHFFEADEDEEKDLLLDDIYRFIHFWLKKISNGTDMKKLYREFSGGLKENEQFASLTEDAQEVVSTLRFSLELYLRYRKDKEKLAQEYGIENLDTFCTDILIEVAKDAFPMPNDVTYSALEEAKELCRVLDQYFAK